MAFWVSLIFSIGFLFAMIPNVEFVTLLAFLAGVLLSYKNGIAVAVMGEGLYSALNPIGSGLAFPALFMSQIIGMGFIAYFGALLSKVLINQSLTYKTRLLNGIIGALLTLSYDGITALSYPLTAGMDWSGTWKTLLVGLPFFSIHMVANVVIFAWVMPELIKSTHMQIIQFQLQLTEKSVTDIHFNALTDKV